MSLTTSYSPSRRTHTPVPFRYKNIPSRYMNCFTPKPRINVSNNMKHYSPRHYIAKTTLHKKWVAKPITPKMTMNYKRKVLGEVNMSQTPLIEKKETSFDKEIEKEFIEAFKTIIHNEVETIDENQPKIQKDSENKTKDIINQGKEQENQIDEKENDIEKQNTIDEKVDMINQDHSQEFKQVEEEEEEEEELIQEIEQEKLLDIESTKDINQEIHQAEREEELAEEEELLQENLIEIGSEEQDFDKLEQTFIERDSIDITGSEFPNINHKFKFENALSQIEENEFEVSSDISMEYKNFDKFDESLNEILIEGTPLSINTPHIGTILLSEFAGWKLATLASMIMLISSSLIFIAVTLFGEQTQIPIEQNTNLVSIPIKFDDSKAEIRDDFNKNNFIEYDYFGVSNSIVSTSNYCRENTIHQQYSDFYENIQSDYYSIFTAVSESPIAVLRILIYAGITCMKLLMSLFFSNPFFFSVTGCVMTSLFVAGHLSMNVATSSAISQTTATVYTAGQTAMAGSAVVPMLATTPYRKFLSKNEKLMIMKQIRPKQHIPKIYGSKIKINRPRQNTPKPHKKQATKTKKVQTPKTVRPIQKTPVPKKMVQDTECVRPTQNVRPTQKTPIPKERERDMISISPIKNEEDKENILENINYTPIQPKLQSIILVPKSTRKNIDKLIDGFEERSLKRETNEMNTTEKRKKSRSKSRTRMHTRSMRNTRNAVITPL